MGRLSLNVETLERRRRQIKNRPEEAIQIAVAELLTIALPRNATFWHTPNGGFRTKVEAAKFKKMGVKAGFPDIGIVWRERLFCIELKARGETLSTEQIGMHAILRDCGVRVETAQSVDEVIVYLHEFGIPCRAQMRDRLSMMTLKRRQEAIANTKRRIA